MNYQPDMKESRRLIEIFSVRVMRRLPVQALLAREDIIQELWIAWCAARDSFDETLGVPFGAFLHRGMLLHINRFVEKHVWRFKEQTFALSLNAEIDGNEFSETVASDAPAVEDELQKSSCYSASMKKLSNRAQTFVRILHEQPEAFIKEVMLSEDKAEHAKKIGAPYLQPRRVTSTMVFDLMSANKAERIKILHEVTKVGERMTR